MSRGRFATAVAVALALVALGVLAWAIIARVAFPFALEWQEAAMLEHAQRVLGGEPLYVEPGLDFAPFPYPPLFHWCGALAIGAFGETLPALRSVSLVSLAGVLLCVFALCRRRGGTAAGWIGAGVFAATYTWTGQWMDVARVDTLALALLAASLVLVSSTRATAGRVLPLLAAGALGALAVLAKQTSLGVVVAIALGLFLRRDRGRPAVVFTMALGLVLLAIGAWLEARSGGWFRFTVINLLAGSPWHQPAIFGFWGECALVFAPLSVLWMLGRRSCSTRSCEPQGAPACTPGRDPVLTLALVALVLVAWAGRAHEGGFRNTLLPAALAGAIVAGPAIARACVRSPLASHAPVVAMFSILLFAFPRSPLPSPELRAQATRLAAHLAAIEGEVWQPHGAIDPGVHGGVHAMALTDLLKSRERDVAQVFVDALARALDERRYAAIVLGVEPQEWGGFEALARNYVVSERLDGANGESTMGYVQPTGADRRARVLLVPR